MTDKVTQADIDAAQKFGDAWRMSAAMKYGLANILSQHRTNTNTELVEALREIAAGVEKRMHDGTTVVDDHPDAMEIARKALSLYGDER